MREAGWVHLLDEDPDFKRWHDNLARNSIGTANERARVLFRFLKQTDMTPHGLAELGLRVTFLTEEGTEYLSAYLEKRLAQGEKLAPDSAIIAVKPGFENKGKSPRNRGSAFIVTRNIAWEIREAMRPRFNWRPYVLRAYFDTGSHVDAEATRLCGECLHFRTRWCELWHEGMGMVLATDSRPPACERFHPLKDPVKRFLRDKSKMQTWLQAKKLDKATVGLWVSLNYNIPEGEDGEESKTIRPRT